MRLLFTSVGRRVELMQAFRAAAEKCNIQLEIFGADISDSAPALFFCNHKVIVPKISDKSYIPFLIDFCEENNIDALVPTIDTDLMVLSENAEKFNKTKVVISKPEKIALCRDKRLTADYLIGLGLNSPKPVDDFEKYQGSFPAFIKPKDGSSSIFAYKANDSAELKAFTVQVPDYIIQPFIDGTEYTVDVFCDFDGNPIFITPRIRLAVRSGEVLKTKITQDKKIISEVKTLIDDFKPCGQITVQLIRDNKTGEDFFIEINPRFGGGAPLSIKAGADSARMLLRVLQGEQISFQDNAAEDGAVFSRFDQSIRVN